MIWKELVDISLKEGYMLTFDDHYENCEVLDKGYGLNFFENGMIKTDFNDVVSINKTPEQMWQIMEALK